MAEDGSLIMLKLVTIEAFGIDVTPWSVPNIGVNRKGAKPVRFTTRGKKSNLDRGSASLEHWQAFVKGAAREAWNFPQFHPLASTENPRPPFVGPVHLEIEFYARTPAGKRHGELWEVPLKLNKKGDWGKTQPRKKSEPDLINMFKATEDAICEVVLANDVQTRMVSAVTLYGRAPGVRVTVYAIDPEDFPGVGEPLEI
jgi:Holliday junction resolvase RusA-like endonuclease